MLSMEQRTVSSMNYFFLRAIFKEEYPDSITEELPYFLNGIVINIKNDPEKETAESKYLYDYVFQELDEGDYTNSLDEVPQKIKEFCMNLDDMDEYDIDILCAFYKDICKDVREKWLSLGMEEYVKTNIGEIPLEDYYDIRAMQYGYESYQDMKECGLSLDRPNTFFKSVEHDKTDEIEM